MKLIDISTPKHPNTFAKVDDEDFEFLNQWKWGPNIGGKTLYAKRKERHGKQSVRVSMHRVILATPKDMHTDHIDGDGLNNQRGNLRVCTRAQNQMNQRMRGGTSKYRGVCFDKTKNKWEAAISFRVRSRSKPVRIKIGRYSLETDAAKAYNETALRIFGEFVRLNDIPE